VNRFGIDRENLTSANALLPIAYYLHRIESGSLDGSTPFESSNAMRIHRWLIGSLLNGVFGGSSDQTIGASRTIIQESLVNGRDFPYRPLVDGLARRGRLVSFDDNNVEGVLDINYGQRGCFLALSLIYDTNNWGSVKHHMDHIIPRSLADRKALMAKNLPEPLTKKILDSANRLGNLQLLLGRENLEKSNIPFAQWIQTRDAAIVGAGAVILMPALVLLLFAIAAALTRSGFSEPVSYLLAGGGAALISGALIATGLSRLSGDALKPSVTLDQVQRDKVAVKGMVR
jgi:hypothetical protein